MGNRLDKINELIKKELGELIVRNIDFPEGCLATITDVFVSKDLRHAKVLISAFPADQSEKILNTLSRDKHIQGELHRKLVMRPLPKIHYALDDTENEAAKIEELLDRIGDSR